MQIIANEISNVTFSVMPTCSASFFKKDSRQAGMTILKSYVNLLNAFVLVIYKNKIFLISYNKKFMLLLSQYVTFLLISNVTFCFVSFVLI